jgi:hypothetical protein
MESFMVKSTSDYLTPSEYDLVEAIQQVCFGEIYGVEIEQGGGQWIETNLSPAMLDLIFFIRSGVQYIDVLTVHQGQPTLAETDCKINGFRCRQKLKFPTIQMEG